jgi:hypothetical protein
MFENIILPGTFILVGFLYLRWVYKVNNDFFRKNVDLFSSSKDLQGWAGGLLILIVGICFLIRRILKYL